MKKRMSIMIISVAILFGGIIGFQQFKAAMMAQWLAGNGVPPATVTTIEAQYSDWTPSIQAVSTLRAQAGIMVVNEVPGMIKKIAIQSGAWVEKGDLILELDDAIERAQLQAAEAAAELAVQTYQRDQKQLQVMAVSQSVLDIDHADLKTKQAQVKQLQAQLDKKRIIAPFAGKLGVAAISVGQYLPAGTALVSLQSTHPILADFTIPQNQMAQLHIGQEVTLVSEAFPDNLFTGFVQVLDSVVDINTRTLKVEAFINNPNGLLLPGMFAKVAIKTGDNTPYLTVPQTAITYNAYGSTLFIAKPAASAEDKPLAEQIFVKTGAVRGDQTAIIEGLSEHAIVITSGQMKLKNGTPLIINNSIVPANNPAPTPQEH
ncbi:MAG: efflux RND transporter periplasmic adaptor subunit [Zetaproteobacteria bacterium]|nr:efflux RND transporter periplasmic adaptor subunit [Zetaproteobacteria bacterium]